MIRTATIAVLVAFAIGVATPAFASEKATEGRREAVAPSAAVAAAWAREEAVRSRKSRLALNSLYVSYGVLHGLDAYSTQRALKNGAREANPLMNNGTFQNTAMRLAMGAVTLGAVKLVAKKNKKAAAVTMFLLNGAMAVVVVNNLKNASR